MTSSLRIALLLNPFTLLRKGGDHAPALARELLGRGHSVRGFGAPPGAIPRSGPDPTLDGGVALEEGIGPVGFRPDVVVAYDGLSPAAWLGGRVSRKLDIPLVLVESGFAGQVRWYRRVAQRTTEALWGRFVRNAARAVVALDPVAREQSLRQGFSSDRIQVLSGGVDLNVFRPGLSSRLIGLHKIRGRVLLHAGRLEPNRGLETLFAAFAASIGQRQDWCLVLAGEGGQRPKLHAMAERLGVGARVRWLGRPRREELPGLMGAATLMAVSALDDGVRGKQIPRALACGLPVLASDLPRLASQVEHDGCGLLAPPGDVHAWCETLRKACGDPAARKRWRARAREIASERFDWSKVAERFERILVKAREELAAERARSDEAPLETRPTESEP